MLDLLPVWLACASLFTAAPTHQDAWFGGDDPSDFVPEGPLVYEQVFLPPAQIAPRDAATYVVRLYGPELERSVEVLRNGERVFAQHGMQVVLFEELERADPKPPFKSLRDAGYFASEEEEEAYVRSIVVGGTGTTPPTDITGDGVPELIIADLRGMNHTLLDRYIFELWPRFRRIDAPSTRDADSLDLTDIDGDGVPELVTMQNPLHDWAACGADTPYDSVVMRYAGDGFVPDPQMMRQPPWVDEVIVQRARAIRADPDWARGQLHGPAKLWQQMLTLCLEGNSSQAWRLLELAWPGDAESQHAYRRAFEADLSRDAFGAAALRLEKAAGSARFLPPDARRAFANPDPQPGQGAERIVEIRGPHSGSAWGLIRVLELGKRVEELRAGPLQMVSRLDAALGVVGTDLDADGQEELILIEGTHDTGAPGGRLLVFRVWPQLDRIGEFSLPATPWQVFANLDDEPDIEIRVREQLRGAWNGWGEPEPEAPVVVLKFDHGRLVPSPRLMRAAPPTPENCRALALALRGRAEQATEEDDALAPLWTEMLRLAYSGNMPTAMELFEQAWPTDREGKSQALEGFLIRIREGEFAPTVLGVPVPAEPEVEREVGRVEH
jgi:hypothetical protein